MSLDVIHVTSRPGRRFVWVVGNRLSKMAKTITRANIKSLEKTTFQTYFQCDSYYLRYKRQQKTSDEMLVARSGSW